jgi:LCP family protein required for cell wall assembly
MDNDRDSKGKSKVKSTKSTNGNFGKRFVKFLFGVVLTLLVLVLVAVGAFAFIYKSGETSLKASASTSAPTVVFDDDTDVKNGYSAGDTIAWQDDWVAYNNDIYEYNEDTLNFLIMGIDRGGELEEDFSEEGPGQADAIFLISLNQKDKKVSIIGIPRNSMVDIDIYNEDKEHEGTLYNQICLQYAYAGGGEFGVEKMKDSVSELFYGLPIHGACAISFDAVGIITDMVGGVEVTIPDDMTAMNPSYKKGSSLNITSKNALSYLRYRSDELGSPTTRLERQKDFIKEFAKVAVSAVKGNVSIVTDIYKAIAPYMVTDITLDKAVYIATESIGYSMSDNSFYQLTGSDKQVDTVNDNGQARSYDDYYLDEDSIKQVLIDVFYSRVKVEMAE